jgi:aerobic C4-dicarboxylate transport protein
VKALLRSLYSRSSSPSPLGVLLGTLYPCGRAMQPLGDGFIKLIKMLIAPVIFCTVVTGIAGVEDMKKVGKTGGLALLYFEVMSTVALDHRPAGGQCAASGQRHERRSAHPRRGFGRGVHRSGQDCSRSPSSCSMSFRPRWSMRSPRGEILQVLLFAVLFGFALQRLGSAARPMLGFIESLSQVLFGIVGIVMRLAPMGAFGAMAFTIGKYGFGSLLSLGFLMGCFYCHLPVVHLRRAGDGGPAAWFQHLAIRRYIRDELFIVLGTSSSESVLPRMIAKLQKMGASKSVVGLVIPAGYSFNLDGTSIYLTMATLFIAQATNTPLNLLQQLTLLAVLLLTSKGAAGVTGSGFIVLAATLSSVGTLPVAGLALILGIDRFMSEARALTNVIGNGVATLVVAKWTGELDVVTMRRELGGPSA